MLAHCRHEIALGHISSQAKNLRMRTFSTSSSVCQTISTWNTPAGMTAKRPQNACFAVHRPSTSPFGHDGLVAVQRPSTSPLGHDGLVEGQCIAKRITRCRNSALQADIPRCSLLMQNEESVSHGLSMVPRSGEQSSISLQQLIGRLFG